MQAIVKQYGEIRTGTNYVRALLTQNYPAVRVLTYILGDKHSPPVSFDALWQETRDTPDPDLEFARRATYSARGSASHDGDLTQLAEIKKRAREIARSVETGSLHFLISIKDPYAWIVSVAKFQQWIHRDGEPLHEWDHPRIRECCLRFNANYAAWRSLTNSNPAAGHWIRIEDLLVDAQAVFGVLERDLGWQRNGAFVTIPEVVEPTIWDHLPVLRTGRPFDASYYSERRYLEQLSPAQRKLITQTIDWAAIAPWGYVPLND